MPESSDEMKSQNKFGKIHGGNLQQTAISEVKTSTNPNLTSTSSPSPIDDRSYRSRNNQLFFMLRQAGWISNLIASGTGLEGKKMPADDNIINDADSDGNVSHLQKYRRRQLEKEKEVDAESSSESDSCRNQMMGRYSKETKSYPTNVNIDVYLMEAAFEPAKYSGKSKGKVAKEWLQSFEYYLMRSGLRRDRHRREALHNYLTDGVRIWLYQLGRRIYKSYVKIRREFVRFFCRESEDKIGKYYAIKRRLGEDPFDFVWRFNLAAKEAKIDVSSNSIVQRRHVDRFLLSIESNSIREMILASNCSSIAEIVIMLQRIDETRLGDQYQQKWEIEDKERFVERTGSMSGWNAYTDPSTSIDDTNLFYEEGSPIDSPKAWIANHCEKYQQLENVANPVNLASQIVEEQPSNGPKFPSIHPKSRRPIQSTAVLYNPDTGTFESAFTPSISMSFELKSAEVLASHCCALFPEYPNDDAIFLVQKYDAYMSEIWIRAIGDQILPTVINNKNERTIKIRYFNAGSKIGYIVTGMPLAIILQKGQVPRHGMYVKIDSPEYHKWQVIIYGKTTPIRFREIRRDLKNSVDHYPTSPSTSVNRVFVAKRILKKGEELGSIFSAISDKGALKRSSSQVNVQELVSTWEKLRRRQKENRRFQRTAGGRWTTNVKRNIGKIMTSIPAFIPSLSSIRNERKPNVDFKSETFHRNRNEIKTIIYFSSWNASFQKYLIWLLKSKIHEKILARREKSRKVKMKGHRLSDETSTYIPADNFEPTLILTTSGYFGNQMMCSHRKDVDVFSKRWE